MQKATRRKFIKHASILSGAGLVATNPFARMLETLAAGSGIKLGYASITWNEDHIQFLKDVTT
ncbi:MAG: twin-arginine translocation signal domain-containing protein [Bacteroidota bacterium]